MKDGFIKVASATPDIRVADCEFNSKNIISLMQDASKEGAKILVLPELCVTGYTCGDLFLQKKLIDSAFESIKDIALASAGLNIILIVGTPISCNGKLYNCAVVMLNGEILGIIPKTHLPNYSEFYEQRHFSKAPDENKVININGEFYLFGTKIIFTDEEIPEFSLAVEICEDLWVPNPPSISHANAGATIIVNPSASDEIIGKDSYRRSLVQGQSGSLVCAYIYSGAGEGESSTDMIFAGHNIIAENGAILIESKLFENSIIYSEIDISKLAYERRRITTFSGNKQNGYETVLFEITHTDTKLTRFIATHPFVPSSLEERKQRCETIFSMQALGLKKRIAHSKVKTTVIGISGGLDSCLALLVTVRAMDMLKYPRKDVIAITMPCFGTTARTKNNAEILCEELGVTFKCIDITEAVNVHFRDISHDPNDQSVVYENSQARERTQILMDVANQTNGLVVGTGDLSEFALGWATYNGDHMSMYAVNTSIPKTLIRHMVKYSADTTNDEKLKSALNDILDTPVSPELLPPKDGVISQVTEDIVGPYELHDFFLYYIVRWGFTPTKVFNLASYSFKNEYEEKIVLKWLKLFYQRFFAHQFKRSCLPDGPKVGSVTLSPRSDWRMPSDACATLWIDELNELEKKL